MLREILSYQKMCWSTRLHIFITSSLLGVCICEIATQDYEVVFPSVIDADGNFVSYDVSLNEISFKSRRKRSLEKFEDADKSQERLYYSLSAYGKTFNLNVSISDSLVSDDYLIEIWGKEKIERRQILKMCHYTGMVENAGGDSSVAISNCDGLRGIIMVNNEQYIVEPLDDDSASIFGVPHIVYRARTSKYLDKDHSCGVPDIPDDNPFAKQIKETNALLEYLIKNVKVNLRNRRELPQADDPFRLRRSIDREYFVETMVVADMSMAKFHRKRKIEMYLLGIMNIVAQMFRDPSLEQSINILITRMVIFQQRQPRIRIQHHADKTLQSFCRWQFKMNPAHNPRVSRSIPSHDFAILFTRIDICSQRNRPCGTLGLTPVGGMCQPDRSCAVLEDIGLASAFTTAHEIGHNFGMQHDGVANRCGRKSITGPRLMAAQLSKSEDLFTWSACSREYIFKFLQSPGSHCLLQKPEKHHSTPFDRYPGAHITADQQCALTIHDKSTHCPHDNLCKELWCTDPDQSDHRFCVTNNIPPIDGTECAINNITFGWCYRGNCVPRQTHPEQEAGHWSEWGQWGDCSRTCAGGIQTSTRMCDNPAPAHGGRYCTGGQHRYRVCNQHPCSPQWDSVYAKSEECAKYNDNPFRGKYFRWIPFGTDPTKRCEIKCSTVGYGLFTKRTVSLTDGTPCDEDGRSADVCVKGVCKKVGCNGVLGSTKQFDSCMVCGGTNSTCKLENVVDFVAEHTNGLDHVDSDEFVKATVEEYDEPDNGVNLSPRSNRADDFVKPPLTAEDERAILMYFHVWRKHKWSTCDAPCGERGTKYMLYVCFRKDTGKTVDAKFCWDRKQPTARSRNCRAPSCPSSWVSGNWTDCNVDCAPGLRRRAVKCVTYYANGHVDYVPDEACEGRRRPPTEMPCFDKDSCVGSHRYQCSANECGARGIRRRQVKCRLNSGKWSNACDAKTKPTTRERCRYRLGDCSTSTGDDEFEDALAQPTSLSPEIPANFDDDLPLPSLPSLPPIADALLAPLPGLPQTLADAGLGDSEYFERERERMLDSVAEPIGSENGVCVDKHKVGYCRLVSKFSFCKRAYFRRMCCNTCYLLDLNLLP